MKKLIIATLTFIFLIFGCITVETNVMATSKNWPTLDVWVMVHHSHKDLRHPPCMVIVHIPKNSLDADENNCPAHDTKLVGEGFSGNGVSTGYHVIILKKGALNDPKSYSLMPPKRKPKLVPDYIHIWTANGNLFTSMDKA